MDMIKMDNFIIVSFITHDTPYELVLAQYLMPSLEKLHLPHHIDVFENRGSWMKNVTYKPQSILNAFEKYPGQDIVSIDADAEILSYPNLFGNIPQEYDMACHFLDWRTWYQQNVDKKELLSGTLFFRNNEKTKKLVTQWLVDATSSSVWEQKALEKLVKESPDLKVYELPLEYCYIESLPDGKPPHILLTNPVIVHHQVSRQLKRKLR